MFFILLSISISKQLLDHCDFTMCKVFPLCLSLSIFLTLTQSSCMSLSLCVLIYGESIWRDIWLDENHIILALSWWSVWDLAKIFLTSKFSNLLFLNPNHKTKTETANRWETTNTNPLGIKNMEQQSDHIYYTLLWRVLGYTVPFTSLNKLCTTGLPKPFCWAKPACFDFSSSNFNFHGHILSTAEAALT